MRLGLVRGALVPRYPRRAPNAAMMAAFHSTPTILLTSTLQHVNQLTSIPDEAFAGLTRLVALELVRNTQS